MINAWRIEWKTNECGVNICHIFCNEEEMGHVYSTMHPTIPYEVYWDNSKKSQRVMNIEEAVEIISASI